MSYRQVMLDPNQILELDRNGFWSNPQIKDFPDFSKLDFEQVDYCLAMDNWTGNNGARIGRILVGDNMFSSWKSVGDIRAFLTSLLTPIPAAYAAQVHRWPDKEGHSVVYFVCQEQSPEIVTS